MKGIQRVDKQRDEGSGEFRECEVVSFESVKRRRERESHISNLSFGKLPRTFFISTELQIL
eukprot:1001064-Amorphochlora_amoeboformis.AAC.1